MLGQKLRRGLPYGFAFLCPVLSCLLLFTVKRYAPKTSDQQALLAAKWKEVSTSTALGLWMKNFFSRKDPTAVMLGFSLTGPLPAPFLPQQGWYPPPGGPGAPGMPPMTAYLPPEQGYPPQSEGHLYLRPHCLLPPKARSWILSLRR